MRKYGPMLLAVLKKVTDTSDILQQLMRIWAVMDDCIRMGVSSAEEKLPGRLGLRRRAPMLYRRLMRGYDKFFFISLSISFVTEPPYFVLSNSNPAEMSNYSFYPGLATSHLTAIGPGSSTSPEAIDAPATTSEVPGSFDHIHGNGNNGNVNGFADSSNGNTGDGGIGNGPSDGNGSRVVKTRRSAARATRVVGSFDHPVLPMPPVSDLNISRFDRLGGGVN